MTLDPTLPEDRWVQVNGLNLHYLDWGGDRTKMPLILMHGIGGHAHQFDDFSPPVGGDAPRRRTGRAGLRRQRLDQGGLRRPVLRR